MGGSRSSAGFDDLGSIFEEMFSGFGGSSRRRQNPADMEKYPLDMNVDMTISFNEAVFGCEKDIEFKYKNSCNSCKGTGAKDGKLSTCHQCRGQGQIYMKQGFMTFSQTCPVCHGSGSAPSAPCKAVTAKDIMKKKETLPLKSQKGLTTVTALESQEKEISANAEQEAIFM